MTTTTPTSGACPQKRQRSRTASADEHFVLTLWTADPLLASWADAAGVDRVGVDLERLGKAERQRGLGTWISPHTSHDLIAIGSGLRRSRLFARMNPVHTGTRREVEEVLQAGAEVLMLPMVVDPRDAALFADLVARRALVVLLLERVEALRRLDEFVTIPGVAEIHIGLNDLAHSLGLRNRWLVLADDLVAGVGKRVRAAGLRFGLGGIGRVDDKDLPVPTDLVYAEIARTGATAALISRSFLRAGENGADLAREVACARARLDQWRAEDAVALDVAHAHLRRRAQQLPGW